MTLIKFSDPLFDATEHDCTLPCSEECFCSLLDDPVIEPTIEPYELAWWERLQDVGGEG